MNAVKKFMQIVNKTNDAMMYVVAIGIFITAITTFYAIIMRFLFVRPPIWSFDLTSWLSAATALLGGGWCLKVGGHVRVDIFWDKLSLRNRCLVDVITSFLMFLVAIVLVWKGGLKVIDYFQGNAMATTGLNIHLWIKWLIVPIGGLLILLQGVVNLINDVHVFVTGEKLLREDV